MKLFNKIKKIIDPHMGKTVIRFTTHGCMGQDERFDFIGVIIGIEKAERVDYSGAKFYVVSVLKDKDDGGVGKTRLIPSWYLIKLSDNLFVAYD